MLYDIEWRTRLHWKSSLAYRKLLGESDEKYRENKWNQLSYKISIAWAHISPSGDADAC